MELPREDTDSPMGSPPADKRRTFGLASLHAPVSEQHNLRMGPELSPESEDGSGEYTLCSTGSEIDWCMKFLNLEPQRSFGMDQTPSPSPEPTRDFGMGQTPSPSPEPKRGFGMDETPSPSPEPKHDFGMGRTPSPSPERKSDFGMRETRSPLPHAEDFGISSILEEGCSHATTNYTETPTGNSSRSRSKFYITKSYICILLLPMQIGSGESRHRHPGTSCGEANLAQLQKLRVLMIEELEDSELPAMM